MTTIKFRRDTSANWTSVNPIPAQGEPCYETDTGKLKIGNGSDNYVSLPYVSDGGGSSGDLPIATATTLGGIKVGDNLSITEDGTLSASSEAKTVKTPSGRIILDDGGLHNQDNSRAIINRNADQQEVRVGNSYEPTTINGASIKLNSTNITDRDGNTFLSGDTIKGVKFYQDNTTGNKNVANSEYTSNRLELTAGDCNLYDSDNRQVFGSSYDSGQRRTNWAFASQSNTVRIAGWNASNGYGLMLKVPTDGTSPTIRYTYYGTDSSLYGKEQTFLRTEDVDNSTIKIIDGKLTANDSNYIKTSQVSKGGLGYGVYLSSSIGSKLDTIQPKFNALNGALKIDNILYLKAATYSASEPADEDMVNNWTDNNGVFTGYTSDTGFISGHARFGAGSGSLQVVFKLMEVGHISGIDQKGSHKFQKIEISTDGTTYTEYDNTPSEARYIRFTFNYTFLDETLGEFSTRIRTLASNIAGGETAPLSVKVDNSTIQIVDDKLHANFDEINGKVDDVSARVTALTNQVGDVSAVLDNINGEVI